MNGVSVACMLRELSLVGFDSILIRFVSLDCILKARVVNPLC